MGFEGKVKERFIDPAVELKETIITTTGLDSGPYYFVLGLTGIESAGQKARKSYVNAILTYFEKYPFKLLIFYGSNRLLTAAINLAKPFVPFKVRVTSDLDKAMSSSPKKIPGVFMPANLLPI